jgi:hypothetical protein
MNKTASNLYSNPVLKDEVMEVLKNLIVDESESQNQSQDGFKL